MSSGSNEHVNGNGGSSPAVDSVPLQIYKHLIELQRAAEQDPDRRKRIFDGASAAVQQDLSAHVFPPTEPSACSAWSSSLLLWLAIFLKGVRDPWSATRKLCLKHMLAIVEAIHAVEEQQRLIKLNSEAKTRRRKGGATSNGGGLGGSSSSMRRRRRPSQSGTLGNGGLASSTSRAFLGGSLSSLNMIGSTKGSAKSNGCATNKTKNRRPSSSSCPSSPSRPPTTRTRRPVKPKNVQRSGGGGGKSTRRQRGCPKLSESLILGSSTTTAVADVPLSDAILGLIRAQWGQASHWYEKEGLLKVWKLLMQHYSDVGGQQAESLARWVLTAVAFPSLSEPQLPVREAAVDLTRVIAKRSPHIASFTLYHAMAALKGAHEALPPSRSPVDPMPSSCNAEEEAIIHCIEGHLLLLIDMLSSNLVSAASRVSLNALVMSFAASNASSVRQYVAEVLQPPSEELFSRLLYQLVQTSLRPGSSWQVQETILMALQHHLTYYLAQGTSYKVDMQRIFFLFQNANPRDDANSSSSVDDNEGGSDVGVSCTRAEVAPLILTVLTTASCSDRFEVARMGKQLTPLVVQWLVRYSGSVKDVVTAVHGLCRSDSVASNPSGKKVYHEIILPSMWWFLSIRSVVDPSLKSDIYAVMEQSEDVQRYIREERTSLAALLIILTYFTRASAGDGDVCYGLAEYLTRVETWVELLRPNSPALQYLHIGIDFTAFLHASGVSTVHLVPVWLAYLGKASTHHQCVLLAMARESISQQRLQSPRPFRFVYNPVYAAPAMMDGGEDLPLGYTWIRTFFRTEAQLPCQEPGASTPPSASAEAIRGAITAVVEHVCMCLYISRVNEPEAIREARFLLIAAAVGLDAGNPEIRKSVLVAIVARLDAISPSWHVPGSDDGAAATPDQGGASSWDDSDSDDAVEGLSAEEELREASIMLARLKRDCPEGELTSDDLPLDVQEKIAFLRRC